MAQVTKVSPERVAWLFGRAEAEWEEMAKLLADWDALDGEEQLSYGSEVPLRVDYLDRLVILAEQDELTKEQGERLRRLQARARALRPRINELTGYDPSDRVLGLSPAR